MHEIDKRGFLKAVAMASVGATVSVNAATHAFSREPLIDRERASFVCLSKESTEEARAEAWLVGAALHRVRLTRAGLPVRKDAQVMPVEDGWHQRLHLVEDVELCCSRCKDAVVPEVLARAGLGRVDERAGHVVRWLHDLLFALRALRARERAHAAHDSNRALELLQRIL